MNGQRSSSQGYRAPDQMASRHADPRQGDVRPGEPRAAGASSLDALSRTIEGLEARIEGLMNGMARDGRRSSDPTSAESVPAPERFDPLAEIRARQRALEAARPPTPAGAIGSKPAPGEDRPIDKTSSRRMPVLELAPELTVPSRPAATAMDFQSALSTLRADLRQDISDSLAGEIGALRAEMRDIRLLAEDGREAAGLRDDFVRMADSIDRIGHAVTPDATAQTDALRADFEDLRSLIDGLARGGTTPAVEARWSALETRLDAIDPERIQQDLLQLAYRLDDIKQQLGSIGDVRSVRLLEDKLIAIAKALEHIGQHLEPNSQAMLDQFGQLDHRLDEISRAISVAGRNNGTATDPRLIERLEDRIATIAHHLELISEQTAGWGANDLGQRIEALSQKIEELAHQQAAQRLEERLDDLVRMLDLSRRDSLQPELTGYLSDISRKIDALDQVSLTDKLAEQIAVIGRRIDEIDLHSVASPVDETLLRSLDDRLYSIAARLDETASAPMGDGTAIAGLEQQIAHLSALISASPLTDQGERIEGRMAALEDYLATSDEYIVEAARQAAEAVMDSYARKAPLLAEQAVPDQTAETLAVLADHLRHLEDISRGGEERSHRTFEALHQTLVQIAEKLDQMDRRAITASTEFQPQVGATSAVSEGPSPAGIDNTEAAQDVSVSATDEDDIAPAVDAGKPSPTVNVEAGKPSLLAGLGRRLKPQAKKAKPAKPQDAASSVAAATTPSRQRVEDAPSIDPADILPPEEANELLEPGSGKPDVRKILEKVRARQAASGSASVDSGAAAAMVKPAGADDRMDFIAAARRAAQAAAQETERSTRPGRMSLADEVKGASAFSRYRRPILMAVGALLLAALAVTSVKNLTRQSVGPTPAAQAPAVQAPASTAPTTEILPSEAPQPIKAVETQTQPAPESTEAETGAAPVIPVTSPPGQASLSAAPIDGGNTVQNLSAQPAQPDAAKAAFVPPQADATKPLFDVPADLSPPSLVTAAKAGDPAALFEIGSRYMEARGLPGDVSQAAVWFQRAADLGLAPAQYRLAGLYEKGTGVQRDLGRARQLYTQAADAGNASAMHNLAVLYASGGDGKPDMDAAAKWFSKAAELGVTDSQFNLAVLYARGSGVKPDLEASYKWFALAARAGDKDAAAKQEEVAKALQPAALERAKASVQQWQATPVDANANSVNQPDEWVGKGLKTGSVDMEKAIRNIQAILNKNGFNAGEPDGKLGARTVAAIKSFQSSVGQEPNGKVSNELVKALLAHNR